MQVQTISTKELRTKFPSIKKDLSKGVHFVLIHRSKPLTTINPYQNSKERVKWPLEKILGGFQLQKKIKQKITPEFINKLAEDMYE